MEQFDVFISYKNTDKNGRPTRDAAMAEALYRALTQKGIRTFFSKYSIDNAARADYMKMIDHALESASILVAVGTSRANLDSGWVSDEIDAFRAMRNSGNGKKRSIISYRSAGFSPNDLPTGLRSCQSYDNQKSVVLFIEACLKKASGFRKDGHVTNLIYEDTGTSVLSAPDGHPASSQNTTPEHAPPKQGLKVGDVVNGRYKILNSIGRGGSSEVYLASDNRINRTYAVKEIRPNRNMDFGFIQRHLLRESLLIQKLNHPAIPKIYDIINDGESVIIVMDYVEGCDLNQLLSKRGPFHEEQVLDFARQIAKVLVHLHERPTPIIYRDMKPANLILRPDDTLALIDFGTAREYKTGAVGDTVCLGTVGFAAPEQYAGKGQTDARTDIYNLGATLHQLVTGKNPAEPPYEMLPIRQIDPNLSRGLEFIIEKCTRNDPGSRFQSAAELLDALDHVNRLGTMSLLTSLFNGGSVKATPKQKPQKQAPPPCPVPLPTGSVPVIPARIPGPVVPGSTPGYRPPSVRPSSVTPDPLMPVSVEPVLNNETEQTIYNAPTEVLLAQPPYRVVAMPETIETPPPAPKKTKANVRKVTVRTSAPAKPNAEMDELIAKLTALDPDSQQLVRDLIERLSK